MQEKGEAFASPFPLCRAPYQAWPLPFAALTLSFSVLKVAGVAVPARVVLMRLVDLAGAVALALLIGALARLAGGFRFRRVLLMLWVLSHSQFSLWFAVFTEMRRPSAISAISASL